MTLAEKYHQKGILEGEIKGEVRGRLEASHEIARNLFNCGMNAELIAQTTNLPLQEIQQLKNTL